MVSLPASSLRMRRDILLPMTRSISIGLASLIVNIDAELIRHPAYDVRW
jgi:hypothetical protein